MSKISESVREGISQGSHRCSCRIDAPENALDADFQAGYLLGKMQEFNLSIADPDHPIAVEWNRRHRPKEGERRKRFERWKAGWWAGVFAAIIKDSE